MSRDNTNSSNKNQSLIDLHLHTTASDGTFSPAQVVEIALELNLKAIAITDHDSIGGISEAINAAKGKPIEVVPGIEFSTEINNTSIHIVGLYIDYQNEDFVKFTHEIKNAREIRARKIIEKINSLNIGSEIDFKDILEVATGFIGRPHIAEVMVEKGIVKTIDEAFDKYLNRGKPAYVPRYKLTPVEAVKILSDLGALPILAHPGYYFQSVDLEELILELKEVGLKGIEVYYPSHTDEDITKFKELARKFDLVESGGSDCHGEISTGILIGSVRIPFSVLEKIKRQLKEKS